MHHHMHAAIKRAGDEWKVMQGSMAHKSSASTLYAAREWPLKVAASGEAERQALREIKERRDGAGCFDSIPVGQRTLKLSNRLFKQLSRQATRMKELLTRHENCPFLIFRLLSEPEGTIAKLRTMCRGRLDDYTQAFLDYYTLDGCTTREALGELTIIMIMAQLSTLALENGNAGITHAISVMSAHVRLPPIGRISADRLAAKIRSWTKALKTPAGMRKEGPRTRVSAKERRLEAQRKREGKPAKTKQRRGHGGRWRTFIKRRCRGVGKADFKELGRLYRALTPEEKAGLLPEARQATAAGRLGGDAYGPKPREEMRAVERAAKRRRVVAVAEGALVPVARDPQELQAFSDSLALYKSDQRVLSRSRKDDNHAKAVEVKRWRDTVGVQKRDSLAMGVPALATAAPALTGECCSKKETLLSWSFPADVVVPRAIGAMRATRMGLVDACAADWNEVLHSTVIHAAQEPIVDPPRRAAHAKLSCYEADGVCLCGDHGDDVWAFKVWMCKEMSSCFYTPDLKHDLVNGDVVLRLLSSYSDDNEELPAPERWFHISTHYLNPYKCWLTEVEWPSQAEDARTHIHLQCVHKYWTMMQMIADIYQADSAWDLRFYKLVDDDLPVVSIDPNWIRVKHMALEKRPATHAPRRRRAAVPNPALFNVLDGLVDEGGDAGSGTDGGEGGSGDGDGDTKSNCDDPPPTVDPDPEPKDPATSDSDASSAVDLFYSDGEEPSAKSSTSSDSGSEDREGVVAWLQSTSIINMIDKSEINKQSSFLNVFVFAIVCY